MESDCAECGFNADRIHTMEKRRKEITIHTRNDSAPARNSVDSFRRLRGERERESAMHWIGECEHTANSKTNENDKIHKCSPCFQSGFRELFETNWQRFSMLSINNAVEQPKVFVCFAYFCFRHQIKCIRSPKKKPSTYCYVSRLSKYCKLHSKGRINGWNYFAFQWIIFISMVTFFRVGC